MKYDISKLITMTQAVELLDTYDFSLLQFYKRTGRFVKPITVAGINLYNKDEVLKWQPKQGKAGRPKK